MPLTTATQIADALARGGTTSVEVTTRYLERAEALNPRINGYVSILRERALEKAAASDRRRAAGQALSAVDGVPIAVKDNICLRGAPTTCASRILANYTPPFDATVVEKLEAAGLVVLGKTNLDEFAMGSSNQFSAAGVCRNPWNVDHAPGGSSGGSAAVVAAGMAPWALGSDTGGSIRQPAGFCGVTGLKPTYGRVSRYGLVAFASSLDQIGPVTVDARDAALLLGLIAGHDPRDSTSSREPVEGYADALEGACLRGLRIGRPREFFEVEGIDPEVAQACEQALARAADAGAEIVDLSMPYAEEYAVSTYYVLATAEASSNLARYDGAHYGHRTSGTEDIVEMFSRTRSEGFGDEVKRRIMLGTFVLSAETFDAYYLRASKARTLIQRDFDQALAKADLLAAPVSPTPAFRLGEMLDDPVQMYLADIFTLSLNLAGYCGVSTPAGFSASELPIGLQLFGGAFRETALLKGALALEQALGVVGSRTAPAAT